MEEQKPPASIHIAPLSTPGENVQKPLQPGAPCPRCGIECGYVISGGGGCT